MALTVALLTIHTLLLYSEAHFRSLWPCLGYPWPLREWLAPGRLRTRNSSLPDYLVSGLLVKTGLQRFEGILQNLYSCSLNSNCNCKMIKVKGQTSKLLLWPAVVVAG